MTLAHTHARPFYPPTLKPKINWAYSTLILAVIFVSFHPLVGATDPNASASGGDIVNQLGFGTMGLVCLYLLFRYVPTNVRAALSRPLWAMVLVVLVLSVFTADNFSGAIRAMAFSLIVVLAAATALALPRSMSDLNTALAYSCLITLGMCYFAVFFVPEQGIHGGGGYESQHAGLWRGVYPHKNISSYVMGVFFMIGLFISRNGRPVLGVAVAVLSLIFVINSGSKTALIILPVAIATAAAARIIKVRFLRWLIILLPVASLFMVTLGGILHPPILEQLREIVPNLTYTGRTEIWKFGIDLLRESPWLGYGFESFWDTPRVKNMEQPIELSWDIRGIVHGHNSWMDGAIAFGIPGMLIIFMVLVIMPIRDFTNIPNTGNAAKIATLFIGIWVFTALGANLESFFFRRSDPIWFCMLLAVIGLRITAHMTSKSRHTYADIGPR